MTQAVRTRNSSDLEFWDGDYVTVPNTGLGHQFLDERLLGHGYWTSKIPFSYSIGNNGVYIPRPGRQRGWRFRLVSPGENQQALAGC
jgi:hypothetical protein